MAEYIERESIKKSINSLLDMVLKFTHSPIEIKQLVFDVIDEERAADVQPVKHGRWIERNDWIECSVCGFEVNDRYCEKRDMTCTETSYDLCPKCGAKMIKDGDTNG